MRNADLNILLVCAGLALIRAVRTRSKAWTLPAFIYGSWGLGDVCWLACLLVFEPEKKNVLSGLSGQFLHSDKVPETNVFYGTGTEIDIIICH